MAQTLQLRDGKHDASMPRQARDVVFPLCFRCVSSCASSSGPFATQSSGRWEATLPPLGCGLPRGLWLLLQCLVFLPQGLGSGTPWFGFPGTATTLVLLRKAGTSQSLAVFLPLYHPTRHVLSLSEQLSTNISGQILPQQWETRQKVLQNQSQNSSW